MDRINKEESKSTDASGETTYEDYAADNELAKDD